MFFPLGLGFKTRTFPFITWLIIISCSLFHYFVQEKREYEKEYMSLQTHQRLEEAHNYLFYEYCKQNLGNGLCERFAWERGLMIQAQDFSSLERDFSLTHSAIAEFGKVYENFLASLDQRAQEVRELPSYTIYKSLMTRLEAQTQKIREKYHLLHHDNLTATALLLAVFSHENFLHLAGNMLFLFIFGRYVEARMGRAAYGLLYLILGSAALGLYAYVNPQPFLRILGASANVSAVMGAFYALFFHQKLKIFFFYIASKIAEFPVKTYMFFFFMLQEFVYSMTAEGNVAYFAHALGLALGMGGGFLWGKARPVPKDFLYSEELRRWNKIKNEPRKERFLDQAMDILKYNPHNKTVISAVIARLVPEDQDFASLELEEEILLREFLPGYLHDLYRKGELTEFFKTIQQVPHSWSMSSLLKKFSQKDLLKLIDQSIDQEELLAGVLFIQAFVERYKRSRKIKNLLKTLKSILDHMALTENYKYHLKKIKDLTSSKRLRKTIDSKLAEEGA